MTSLRWGLLSTAAIGRLVVAATRGSDAMEFVAVASRDGAKAEAFAPDPWIGVSAALELRRGTQCETISVDLPAGSRLGLDEGAVYRHELDLVSRAALSGSPLPFGPADAVAQAATLEALDTSARSGSPVVPRPGPAPSGT